MIDNPLTRYEISSEPHLERVWVLSKTSNTFPAIAIDQAHEQENKDVKTAGGAVGLTENPIAFRRWMLSGPETARLLFQFDQEYLTDNDPDHPRNYQNHEMGQASQRTFQHQVNSLTVERSSTQNMSRLSSMTEQDQFMILSRETAYLSSENLTPSPPQNREIRFQCFRIMWPSLPN